MGRPVLTEGPAPPVLDPRLRVAVSLQDEQPSFPEAYWEHGGLDPWIGGKRFAATGVAAVLSFALMVGADAGDEPRQDLEEALQLQPPEGSCVTGVDISYMHGQTYEVVAGTPERAVAEIAGLSTAEASLQVRDFSSQSKVVDIYKGGVKTGVALVENVGTLAEPA